MASTNVVPAEAARLFRNVTVQVGTRIKVKDKDTGKERDAFKADNVPLKAEHILAAVKSDDGKVSITTVDGQKYSAAGSAKSAD